MRRLQWQPRYFPTIEAMIAEEGWTDIGNDTTKCGGKPGQFTCHANDGVQESRIDYIIANDRLTPAITSCRVDNDADYPTHRPIIIEVETKKLETETKQLQQPTNFAMMFEDKVQEEVSQ